MSLFFSHGRKHLEGHKELSKHEFISVVSGENMPKKVYFPTMSPNGKPITYVVKEGDTVKKGTKIGQRSDFYVPIYSSVSGKVVANEMIFDPFVGRPIAYVVIENNGKYEEDAPLKTVSVKSSKEEIVSAIKEAGLVGLGGAGFPTYVKYEGAKDIHTLLVNGVECEPYLTTDFVKMSKDTENLLIGCELLMKASGASNAIIAFKVGKDEVKNSILEKLGDHPNISIREVPDAYPMGWERVLIKEVFNKEYNKLPGEIGVVINNAQTVIELAKVLTTGKPMSERLVTVSGNAVAHPSNVLCPVGTKASDLIALCGGYTEDNVNVLPGGPMCAKAVMNDNFAIAPQIGAITILKFDQKPSEACLRCGKCTENCPAHLQPVELKLAYERKDTARMEKLNIMSCVECGMCSFVCPSKIDVTDTIKKAKLIYRLQHK